MTTRDVRVRRRRRAHPRHDVVGRAGRRASSPCSPTATASTPAATSTWRRCSSASARSSTPPTTSATGARGRAGARRGHRDARHATSIRSPTGPVPIIPDSRSCSIGHSMGGLIAARFAQRYGDELSRARAVRAGRRRQPGVRDAARDGPDPGDPDRSVDPVPRPGGRRRLRRRPARVPRTVPQGDAASAAPAPPDGRRRRGHVRTICRRCGSTAPPTNSCRTTSPRRRWNGSRAPRCGTPSTTGRPTRCSTRRTSDEVLGEVADFLREVLDLD